MLEQIWTHVKRTVAAVVTISSPESSGVGLMVSKVVFEGLLSPRWECGGGAGLTS